MPKYATELAQGQAFARTSEDAVLADTASRCYKVILSSPAEVFDPQSFCGVYVGGRHPYNTNLTCCDFSAKFDGESRMVAIVTFNYRSNLSVSSSSSHKNPKQQHPRERPATWTTSSSLVESMAESWRYWYSDNEDGSNPTIDPWVVPQNPNFEIYEGVSKQSAITDIRITQYVDFDPMSHHRYAGYINDSVIQVGSLACNPHTLLVRGVDVKPTTEPFMGEVWSGYEVVYSLSYKRNTVNIPDRTDSSTYLKSDIGWDRLQVVEGYKVFNNGIGVAGVDQTALALKQVNGQVVYPYDYADNTQFSFCAAQTTVSGRDGGKTQVRASSPVALNLNGTPRDLVNTVAGKKLAPIVLRYQVQPDADLRSIFNLRLTG
jgi:hypothetical protein